MGSKTTAIDYNTQYLGSKTNFSSTQYLGSKIILSSKQNPWLWVQKSIGAQGRASGKTALGAPWHGQGSTSSMPGPMAMQLPTIVYHV
jgi:hypothetical protein